MGSSTFSFLTQIYSKGKRTVAGNWTYPVVRVARRSDIHRHCDRHEPQREEVDGRRGGLRAQDVRKRDGRRRGRVVIRAGQGLDGILRVRRALGGFLGVGGLGAGGGGVVRAGEEVGNGDSKFGAEEKGEVEQAGPGD